MKTKFIAAVAVAVVVGAGFYVWYSRSTANEETGPAVVTPMPALPPVADTFKDTSMLKPPAGANVAVYEFDDLECPACAHALPILHAAVLHYNIPLVHHDFPLTEIHVWSFDAAVTARYLQDNISAGVADDFRRDVFAHQREISSKEDLDRFTKAWFQQNGQKMPFVIDASGACRNEVQADRALGDRLGVRRTPCIFVVTEHSWKQVEDVSQLSQMIDAALAETGVSSVDVPRGERRKV